LLLLDEWKSCLRPLIGLTFFTDDAGPAANLIMAASTFPTIPVLAIFFIFQKQLMSGVVTSGVKG
jgi:multiple sugar transport system permease protein